MQNRLVPVNVEAQITHTPEHIVQLQEPQQPENIVEQQIVEFNAVEQVSPVEPLTPEILDSVSELEEILEEKVKDEPGVTDSTEPLTEVEVKPVSEPDSLVQDLLNIAEPSFSMAADNEPQQGATESSVEMKSSLNVAGKFKGLLDKVKNRILKAKRVIVPKRW